MLKLNSVLSGRAQADNLRAMILLGAFLQVGCTPNWYDGEFAILNEGAGVSIEQSAKDLGDCYRVFSGIPTVYEISRPDYTLHIAHGDRYWPEFYFFAEADDQSPMEIIGAEVVPVDNPWTSAHQQTEEARGVVLSHKSVKLGRDMDSKLSVAILDSGWNIVGVEELSFKIVGVNCLSWGAT